MKQFILTLTIGFFCNSINAQITGPDTVAVNTNVQFSTPYQSPYYSWSDGAVSVDQQITPGNYETVLSAGMNTACFTTINYDNGNYYSFLISYTHNSVYRVSYGNSPLNVPIFTNIGTFGLNTGQTDGIDIAKDSVTGNWYAFVLGGSQFLRLNFGSSLNNTPTATMMTFPTYMQWPHQLFLKKEAGQWMMFVANRSGSISRFDFGNSLSNTPTGHNIPAVAGIAEPVGFFLYKQSNNWHMIVLNLIEATLTRLDFGANLQNNAPTGVNLGNPGGMLTLPRGSSLIAGCDELLGYILNQDGSLVKLDFQNDITNNTPTPTYVGTTSAASSNNLVAFVYNDSLYWLRTNTHTYLFRTKVMTYPAGSSSGFDNNTFDHTFTQTGTYDITVHCGQGTVQGPASFCKQIVVLDSFTKVNAIRQEKSVQLYPNPNSGLFVVKGKISTSYSTVNMQLIDLSGKVLQADIIKVDNSTLDRAIDIRQLPAGTYFLKLNTPDYSETITISKNR